MNTLYPIFLNTANIRILLVGGGHTAKEKLHFLLKNSPDAQITLVAKAVIADILPDENLAKNFVTILQREFEPADLHGIHIVIAATDNPVLHQEIYQLCKTKNILINVADTPALCDFYLGSIVTKGDIKIAISTNGKSPTLAKRLREFFEDILPDEIATLADNLNSYRNEIKGDLQDKIRKLNELTRSFLKPKE